MSRFGHLFPVNFLYITSIMYSILPKMSPLPSLTSKFLHRYFYLMYEPPTPTLQKCIVSKTNLRRSSRMQFFIVWMVCLLHLSALSVTYHGQSILISSKRSLMAAKAYSLVNLTTPFPSTGCIVSPARGSNTFSAGEESGLVHKANNGPGYRTWVR